MSDTTTNEAPTADNTTLIPETTDTKPADPVDNLYDADVSDNEPPADTEEEQTTAEGKENDDTSSEPLDLSDVKVDLPEGVTLNKEVLGELGKIAGELKLSKEDATKFVPLGAKLIESAMEKQQAAFKETRKEWVDQVYADKEIGGHDDKTRKQKLAIASKGLEKFGSKDLRSLLNDTGLGDHPEVIRMLYRVGLVASEDSIETGGSGDTGSSLDALYPSMAAKK